MRRFCPAVGVGHRTITFARREASQLSLTVNEIVPGPVPDCPPATVTHEASGTAVHEHPCCVLIDAVRVYGTAMHTLNSMGATEYSQLSGMVSPPSLILNV